MSTSAKVFVTSDGFLLQLDESNNVWTDGDLAFLSDLNGLPMDDAQNALKGTLLGNTTTEVAKFANQMN